MTNIVTDSHPPFLSDSEALALQKATDTFLLHYNVLCRMLLMCYLLALGVWAEWS